MGVAGLALVATALLSGDEFRLLGAPLEKRFGVMLGAVGILGGLGVGYVMRDKMKSGRK